MKIQNIYHLLQAALLLLLVSCTQEEFPAVQDKAQQLTMLSAIGVLNDTVILLFRVMISSALRKSDSCMFI